SEVQAGDSLYCLELHGALPNKRPFLMSLSGPVRCTVVALFVALLALSGCAHKNRQLQQSSPEVLYKKAKKSLNSYDYNSAIKTYEQLTARFPFTDEARQARLDLIYAYYRAGEKESATDAADTFIRENPTHPRVDYAYYIKGLVDFERTPNAMESLFHADLAKRPPSTARKSFAAFKTVVEQYPKSEYAHDSLQRMVYLRDRLASYEVNVARYYYKRGAYIAASQRARGAIEQYDGSPAVQPALDLLIQCYDHMQLEALAKQSREVYAANYSTDGRTLAADGKESWWRFWCVGSCSAAGVAAGDRIAPVAPEGAPTHPHSGRRLTALVFVALHEVQYPPDRGAVEAARFDLIHRQVLFDERLEYR